MANEYATLAEYKDYAKVTGADTSRDDSFNILIEGASRYFDVETLRTFYARTETRKFDLPSGRELKLDDDLLTITTLTNGDDTAISSSDYILLPNNYTPKRSIKLIQSSSVLWVSDSSGNTEQIIDVAGTWGFVATHPPNVKTAVLEIAKGFVDRRKGKNITSVVQITGAGVVISPRDVPQTAQAIINHYKKRV